MTDPDQSTPLTVSTELPCRGCRHILYGLSVTMNCPECGLPIEETLRTSIDLESLHGQALEKPRRVAVAVTAFALSTAISLGAGVLVPVIIATTGKGREGDLDRITERLIDSAPILGSLVLITAVLASFGLLTFLGPNRQFDAGTRHVHRWVRAIGFLAIAAALVGFAVISASGRTETGIPCGLLLLMADLVLGMGAIFSIIALDAVLREIGSRSEQYRRAGRGLQSARPMVVGITLSILTGLIGLVALESSSRGLVPGYVEGMLFVRLALVVLLGVGGVYLLANAVWATAPFWRGPWRFDQVVGSASSQTPASMADDSMSDDTG